MALRAYFNFEISKTNLKGGISLKISWYVIFYQVVLPIVILVISGYVIPLIRNFARAQKNLTKKQELNALADILDVVTKIANAQVIQTEARQTTGATGIDKKQVAVKGTKAQAQQLGLDIRKVDVASIVESVFSRNKQALHKNYAGKVPTLTQLKPLNAKR
ncbi:phage holin, LLH family [Agrilactobacillus composti]|uniref:phage holin, LLH family n=1 Tax=Agrilactobacillus composti TaxID=398555 RepID=UPI0009DF9D5F|nr:phage holin, LLH family [Agrilactobacillus composti]